MVWVIGTKILLYKRKEGESRGSTKPLQEDPISFRKVSLITVIHFRDNTSKIKTLSYFLGYLLP